MSAPGGGNKTRAAAAKPGGRLAVALEGIWGGSGAAERAALRQIALWLAGGGHTLALARGAAPGEAGLADELDLLMEIERGGGIGMICAPLTDGAGRLRGAGLADLIDAFGRLDALLCLRAPSLEGFAMKLPCRVALAELAFGAAAAAPEEAPSLAGTAHPRVRQCALALPAAAEFKKRNAPLAEAVLRALAPLAGG